MEDKIINLLDKYNLLAFQERFLLAGVRTLKDLAQIDRTALRSQFLMLEADINNFEKLRNECIIATQLTTPVGSLPPPSLITHSMESAINVSSGTHSLITMDSGPEAIRHSIRPDSFLFIVVDSESRNPIGEVHVEQGAYLLKCFPEFETGGVKGNIIKQHTKIQKYDLESSSEYKGLGLIFVVESFDNGHVRLGASNDVKNLKNLFNKMRLKVIIFSNPTRERIIYEISSQVEIHLESSSFFIAISSHGKEGNQVLCADNQPVTVAEILAHFQIPPLLGKPKVFIIEACRGDKHDSIILTDNYIPDTHTINTYPAATKESDILVAYACVPGYVAYRDKNNGSWFITSLCDAYNQLEEERVDFFGILTYANQIMLQKNCEKKEAIMKQPMHLESTLSKLLII